MLRLGSDGPCGTPLPAHTVPGSLKLHPAAVFVTAFGLLWSTTSCALKSRICKFSAYLVRKEYQCHQALHFALPFYSNSDFLKLVRPLPHLIERDTFDIPFIEPTYLDISSVNNELLLINLKNVSLKDKLASRKWVFPYLERLRLSEISDSGNRLSQRAWIIEE